MERDRGEEHREDSRRRRRESTAAVQDIGDIPAVADSARRAAATASFRVYCETYFPNTFSKPFSPDHLKVIAKIETAVLTGGLFAVAMPRGAGKTSLAERACLWAIMIGAHSFVCLIGSNQGAAVSLLDSIKSELETNDLLLADWPEIVMPIRKLDGSARRCEGQRYKGARTQIEWASRHVVFAAIPGAKASAAVIRTTGITGSIRGMKFQRPDGKSARPSLVVIDDPQTDDSAASPPQCATREKILSTAVLNLAGPGCKIAGIMPCTVIYPDDVADRILSRERHPEWKGERTKMLYAFPKNLKLWAKYRELRDESHRRDGDGSDATDFYRANRAKMDEGCLPAWPERFNADELSAVQNAMNVFFRDSAAFHSECQNSPEPEAGEESSVITVEQITKKLNGIRRRVVSLNAEHLTAFIDVQGKLLFWCVAAWSQNFTGYVVDYGSYPKQAADNFTLRGAKSTLATKHPGGGLESQVYAGLGVLADRILGREWEREDGAPIRVSRCMVDANWGESTDVVYQFCRQSTHATILIPSHGVGVTASDMPMSEHKKRPGEQVGHNWRIPPVAGKRAVRHVIYDTNYWKSFVHARLAVGLGDPGCVSLFGGKPGAHQLFAEHLTAETRIETSGRKRTVFQWSPKPKRPDNHWLDCLTGCAVAASMLGCEMVGASAAAAGRKRRRVTAVDINGPRRRLGAR
mgnify:CR=1 FL=1